jgi:predicted transcriptional regulator
MIGEAMRKSTVFEGSIVIFLVLLCFTVYAMVAGYGSTSNAREVSVNQPVWSVSPGEDGMLYAFAGPTGNTITAIDASGNIKWTYQVPSQWCVMNEYTSWDYYYDSSIYYYNSSYGITPVTSGNTVKPVFASDNGTLYVYIRENRTTLNNRYPWVQSNDNLTDDWAIGERLIAISPGGELLWNKSLDDFCIPASDVNLYARNNMVYAYNSYNLTVFNSTGSVLLFENSVSSPPAVDSQGDIYLIACEQNSQQNNTYYDLGYRAPLDIIKAFYPNGSFYWVNYTGTIITRPELSESVQNQYNRVPLYYNNTLYIPLADGIMAMNTNGTVRWSDEYGSTACLLYPAMPVDANGNLYINFYNTSPSFIASTGLPQNGPYLRILDQNGGIVVANETLPFYPPQENNGDPYSGLIYDIDNMYTTTGSSGWPTALNELVTLDIAAYSPIGGYVAWHYTIPINSSNTIVMNSSTSSILNLYSHEWDWPNNPNNYPLGSIAPLTITSSEDAVYLSFFTATFQNPIVLGQSNCTYSGGIYALSKNGTLLWYKPTDAFASALAANNSTVYYGTTSGKIGIINMSTIAGGITVLAIVYVLFRFFLAGFVTRAKDRVDKNEKRTEVLQYVTDNPGSTMRDTSRGLRMNIGTVRYHLFILSLNHRIVSFKADDKHVRFFLNSNTYNKQEQIIISLMKRENVKKILELLLEHPGLSNLELSNQLKLHESAASRYMKELTDKGIVTREPSQESMNGYNIKSEYKNAIVNAAKHFRV